MWIPSKTVSLEAEISPPAKICAAFNSRCGRERSRPRRASRSSGKQFRTITEMKRQTCSNHVLPARGLYAQWLTGQEPRTHAEFCAAGEGRRSADKPVGENWPSYNGDYSGRRFSSLREINKANVAQLRAAWVFHPGNSQRLEATPVVIRGVMYVTSANDVFALDARTGRSLWHYSRPDQFRDCSTTPPLTKIVAWRCGRTSSIPKPTTRTCSVSMPARET